MSGYYIDIHTHQEPPDRSEVTAVVNIAAQNAADMTPGKGLFSVGLHPWDTGSISFDPEHFAGMISRPSVVAVGECGIDRLRGAKLPVQAEVFMQQARLADAHNKPVIIHCVRMWDEILKLKLEIRPTVPWIIHGFRGKPELAKQLVNHGFYLSFGEPILLEGSTTANSLNIIPVDRLFLETDVSTCSIADIFQAAANIKNLSLDGLQKCILQNFERVFRIHGTSRMASTD